ncbi:MAG: hypothetical protein ACRDBF_03005 [Plesiomonas shigelloides]
MYFLLFVFSLYSDQEKIDSLTPANQRANLEKSNSLLGVDYNKDGIRDDIENFIVINHPEDLKKSSQTVG